MLKQNYLKYYCSKGAEKDTGFNACEEMEDAFKEVRMPSFFMNNIPFHHIYYRMNEDMRSLMNDEFFYINISLIYLRMTCEKFLILTTSLYVCVRS